MSEDQTPRAPPFTLDRPRMDMILKRSRRARAKSEAARLASAARRETSPSDRDPER